jgi:hypothetical protein
VLVRLQQRLQDPEPHFDFVFVLLDPALRMQDYLMATIPTIRDAATTKLVAMIIEVSCADTIQPVTYRTLGLRHKRRRPVRNHSSRDI